MDVLQRWIDWHYSHITQSTGKPTKTSTVKIYLSWLGQYLSHNEIEVTEKIKDELDFMPDETDEKYAMELNHVQTIFSVANVKKGDSIKHVFQQELDRENYCKLRKKTLIHL